MNTIRRAAPLVLGAVALCVTACSSGGDADESNSGNDLVGQGSDLVDHESEAPAEQALIQDGCEALPAPDGGSIAVNPDGPYGHQVALAATEDGITLDDAHQILDHASVPDGVALADGTILVYYVNGETGGVHVARVEDGGPEELGPISIDGAVAPMGVVDPDALLLPDGTVRLYYLGGFGPPTPNVEQHWYICAAESDDGVNFRLLGRLLDFTDEATTDPSVARLSDGSWLMAISQGQRTVLARADDGLNFVQYDTVDFGGVPEVAGLPDGRARLYVCKQGISSYISSDGGATWNPESSNVAPNLGKAIVCDPSWVPSADVFFYKTGGGTPPRRDPN